MPTKALNKIIDEKTERLDTVPDKFVINTKKAQTEAFKEVEKLVLQMDSENGLLLMTDKNTAIINSIDKVLKDAVYNDEYIGGLTEYIGEYQKQANLSDKYFIELNVGFDKESKADTVLASQRNALNVLGEDAFTQTFTAPLSEMLNSSVAANASLLDTMATLREFALGNDEVDGRMVSHVKRIAYDSFAVSDRTYTNAVSNNLGLEFYLYFGGRIEDTREFCAERYGKYFHKKEIEGWGDGKRCCGLSWPQAGKWQGMNRLTNKSTIFTLAGGYNCKHSINPVSIKSVPKNVIQRNIDNGNYKP